MQRIAICEDEPVICEFLAEEIKKSFARQQCDVQIFSYQNPLSLLDDSKSSGFSVYFLDIDMPQIDGISLAKQLKDWKKTGDLCVLFISSHEEMVFRSFEVQPLRFIRKNCFSKEIDEAVLCILEYQKRAKKELTVEINGKILNIPIDKISYIESFSRMQIIHTIRNEYTVYAKMENLEKELTPYGFLRVHKSFLVNYQYIFSIDQANVQLDNDILIPLSKHRASFIKQEYRKLIENL